MIEVRSIDKNGATLYYILCTETNISEGFRHNLKSLELAFINKMLVFTRDNVDFIPKTHPDILEKIKQNTKLRYTYTLRELMLKHCEEFL